MAVIFDIDHEADDFSEWTGTTTDGGDLDTTAGAALAGTNFGLSAFVDDTNTIYAHLTMTDPGSDFRFRWYFDFNSFSLNNNFELLKVLQFFVSGSPFIFGIFEIQRFDPDIKLKFTPYDDAGSIASDLENISDAPHYIEVYWQRATGVAANDGAIEWWIDGVSKGSWGSVDNWDLFPMLNLLRAGALAVIPASASGTLYHDQFVANDDGSEIGAHSPGPAGTILPQITNAYMRVSA